MSEQTQAPSGAVKEEEKQKAGSKKAEPRQDEKEEQAAVPAKFKALVEQIEQLKVLDLAELVKVLEKKFGVSAAVPMAAAVVPSAGVSEAAGAPEEKTSFTVELASSGSNKIAVIKAIRAVTDLGLKDAKDLAESAPKVIKENIAKEEAEKIKKELEAAGAQITLM